MTFNFERLITWGLVAAAIYLAYYLSKSIFKDEDEEDGGFVTKVANRRAPIYKALLVTANILEAIFMAHIAQESNYDFLIRFAMHLIIAAFGSVTGFAVLREMTQAVMQIKEMFNDFSIKHVVLAVKEITEAALSLGVTIAAPYANLFIGYMFKGEGNWNEFKKLMWYDSDAIQALPDILIASYAVVQFHLVGIVILTVISVDSMVKQIEATIKEVKPVKRIAEKELLNFFVANAKYFNRTVTHDTVRAWISNGHKFKNKLILEDYMIKATDYRKEWEDANNNNKQRLASFDNYEKVMEDAYKTIEK